MQGVNVLFKKLASAVFKLSSVFLFRCVPCQIELDDPVSIRDVRCGIDGTMFLTDTGALLACGKYVVVLPVFPSNCRLIFHSRLCYDICYMLYVIKLCCFFSLLAMRTTS